MGGDDEEPNDLLAGILGGEDHALERTASMGPGDEAAASGWDIARKDVRNVGRDGRVPYQKRAHQDTTMLS